MKAESKSGSSGTWQQVRKADSSDSSSDVEECSLQQMIAEAAYYHAERRGFGPDNEMSDWLLAEQDIESSRSNNL